MFMGTPLLHHLININLSIFNIMNRDFLYILPIFKKFQS